MTDTPLNNIYQKNIFSDYDNIGYNDKGTIHTYIQEYELLLAPYRTSPTTSVLEIGVARGHSLRMWREYFSGEITGVDVNVHPDAQTVTQLPNVTLIENDATDPSILHHLKNKTFDVIIDDGSHHLKDQLMSYVLLYNKVRPGGLYIIEDIQNLDNDICVYKALNQNIRIIDNRHIKDRHDDVMIIYTF